MKRAFALIFLLPLLLGGVMETRHFYIYYPQGKEGEALRTGAYLEKFYFKIASLTGNFREKTIVVIQDLGLEANGFTDPIVPSVHIFTGKPHPYHRFGAMRSWWRQVAVHELTHALHLNPARGPALLLRLFFGRALLPGLFQPEFLIEGSAVYSESSLLPYEGRLQEGFYRRFIETRRPWNLSQVMAEPLLWSYYSTRYIYGGEFVGFLANTYGEASLTCLYREYSSSLSQFLGFYPAYHRCFGKGLASLFREFQGVFKGPREKPLFSGGEVRWLEPVDENLAFSSWKVFLPFPNFAIFSAGIYILKGNLPRKIIPRGSSLPLKFRGGKLYYAVNELKSGFPNKINQGYGTIREVVERDLKTGGERIVAEGPILAYDVRDGVLYYSESLGCCGSRVLSKDLTTGRVREIFSSHKIEIYSLAKGDLFYAGGRKDGQGGDLYVLQGGKALRLTQTPYTETDLRWEGRLIFSSNAGGIWRPYSYEGGRFYLLGDEYCASPLAKGEEVLCLDLAEDGMGIFKRKIKRKPYLPGKAGEEKTPATPQFRKIRFGPNLRTLLIPDLYYPYSENGRVYWKFFGHDALEENFYSLTLGLKGEKQWEFDFSTLIFSPLLVNINLSSHATELLFSLPISRSLVRFLRRADLTLWWRMEGKRRALGLSLPLLVVSPSERIRAFLEVGAEGEGKFTQSPLERTERFLRGEFLWAAGNSTGVFFSISALEDEDNPEPHTFKTVSLGELQSKRAILLYAEASHRIANIRKGISLPHLYFDGVYISGFAEAFLPSGESSSGLFLSLEVSSFHGLLRFAPLMGLGYRFDKGEFFPFVGIGGIITPLSPIKPSAGGRNFFSKELKYLRGEKW